MQGIADISLDPPGGYLYPGVDVQGTLNHIAAKATANEYLGQYDFDEDLAQLAIATHDGHVTLGLCSHSIFDFTLEAGLVSVSVDGLQAPQLYVYCELNNLGTQLEC